MAAYTADLWEIELADGWMTERFDRGITLFDPAGVGVLKICAVRLDADVTRDDLLASTELDAESHRYLGERQWGGFKGFQMVYSEDDQFRRKWWLAAGGVLLSATYDCGVDFKETERVAVNEMMDSLRPSRENH